MDEAEPWLEDQIQKRALMICLHNYWPALTPDRIRDLPYDMWGPLAVACDRITAEREQELDEMKRKTKSRKRGR